VVHCVTGDAVHVTVRGAAEDVPVRLARSSVCMDATYVTMSSQKLITIANHSDVVAHYCWTRFATQQAEQQHRARSRLSPIIFSTNFSVFSRGLINFGFCCLIWKRGLC